MGAWSEARELRRVPRDAISEVGGIFDPFETVEGTRNGNSGAH